MMKNGFEQKLERVTKIARSLDEGGLDLAESLELYSEAVEIIKKMQMELDDAKGSVVIMRKELDGSFSGEEAFDETTEHG